MLHWSFRRQPAAAVAANGLVVSWRDQFLPMAKTTGVREPALLVGLPGAGGGLAGRMQACQFEQGYTASVFFGRGAVADYNLGGPFTPDDAVPQGIVSSLMGRYIRMKGGSGNFHELTSLCSSVFRPLLGRLQ